METLTASVPLFTNGPNPHEKLVLSHFETHLRSWEEETGFYCRLLIRSLMNCREEDRPAIESWIAQMEDLNENRLPDLKEKLLWLHTQPGSTLTRARQDAADLRDSYNAFGRKLESLRTAIFRGFSQYSRVQIW
jgi:hypothetical protein